MDFDIRNVAAFRRLPPGGLPVTPGTDYELAYGLGAVSVAGDGAVTCERGLIPVIDDGVIVGFDHDDARRESRDPVEVVETYQGAWVRVHFSARIPRERGETADGKPCVLRVEPGPVLERLSWAAGFGATDAANLKIEEDPLSPELTASAEAVL